MRGSSFPPPLSTKTTLRVPVGMTALTGIVRPSPMSIASSAFTYMPGRSLKSAFGMSIRTLAGIRLRGDGEILPDLKHRQLILVKFRPHPDEAEIGDFDQHVSHFYALALFDGHGLHDAAKRREQRERLGGFAGSFQLGNLF